MKKLVSSSLLLCSLALCGNAAAATWNGAGTDNKWMTADNWGGTAPTSGASLTFDGTTNTSTSNNFTAATQFSGLTFAATAGSFSLSGNKINLTGNITDNSANAQSISLFMALTNNRAVTVAAGGSLSITGTVSGTNFGLSKSGAGSLTLGIANSYTGTTAVSAGSLLIGANNAISSASAVALSGGTVGFTGSFSDTVGALNLTAGASVLDFGGGADTLDFANSQGTWNGTLSIYNWSAGDVLAFGADASGLSAAQLGQIRFYSDAGTTFLGTGAFSGTGGDVSFAAVPEPAVVALLGGGALGLLLVVRRRATA